MAAGEPVSEAVSEERPEVLVENAKEFAASLDGVDAGAVLPDPVTIPLKSVSCGDVTVMLPLKVTVHVATTRMDWIHI